MAVTAFDVYRLSHFVRMFVSGSFHDRLLLLPTSHTMKRFFWLCLLSYLSIPLTAQEALWELTSHPQTLPANVLLAVDETIYSGTYGGGLLSSVDGGDTWKACPAPRGSVSDILVLDDNRLLVSYLGKGVIQLPLSGEHYQIDTVGLENVNVSTLARGSNNLYAGTYNGLYQRSLSTDRWQKVSLPIGPYSPKIHSVVHTPYGVIAGGSQVVFYKLNDASNWEALQLDELTDIVALSWVDSQLLIGTSGNGAYIFTPGDSTMGTPSFRIEEALEGMVQRIRTAPYADPVSLSSEGGLSTDFERDRSLLPSGFLNDYARIGDVEFLSVHGKGIYRRGGRASAKNYLIGADKSNPEEGSGADDILRSTAVFPTVVNDWLTIKLPEALEEIVTIDLLDNTGITHLSAQLIAPATRHTFTGLRLTPGMYWCSITSGTVRYVHPIVVE